jgi:hypothetical protein
MPPVMTPWVLTSDGPLVVTSALSVSEYSFIRLHTHLNLNDYMPPAYPWLWFLSVLRDVLIARFTNTRLRGVIQK